MEGHGGNIAAEVLRQAGVDVVFTLSGGHLFPLYDGCVNAGIRLVDTRHEQTAAFAAEGWAKVTRRCGVAALTAGPGVTNGMSALAGGWFSGSPMLVIGGRAPTGKWGSGSLQEVDHVPLVASVTRRAVTAASTADIGPEVAVALSTATTPPRGPCFLDVPADWFFSRAEADVPAPPGPGRGADPDPEAVATVAKLLAVAARPVIVAGAGVYWDGAETALAQAAEANSVPVLMNGLGRGTLPASHPLTFSRARSTALKESDLVLAVGAPLDFRLGFGSFAGGAKVVHLVEDHSLVAAHVDLAAAAAGDLTAILTGLAGAAEAPPGRGVSPTRSERAEWVSRLAAEERSRREAEQPALHRDTSPVHPARIYGELAQRAEPDAVVVVDGGDFGSYAGKFVDTETPGCFLDPGPYGCLGTGPGYGLAARLAHPDRQVFLLLGDGAAGFSLMDFDTLVRHRAPVVAIVGNNGIWGLEKHPMRALYGYDVVAELRPGTRYDQVVSALGGYGELVENPAEVGPAIDRAVAAGVPALINVLTDPDDIYPRSSVLM
ncbi:MAG: acetolactate synthase [Actinomycetota bacterium]|nr:acetolactate synthase [Actinomycetota bacterium]